MSTETLNEQLSYSSEKMMQGCEQKWAHYKIYKTPKDPDYVENYEAFNVGKAFHDVLEKCKHDSSKFSQEGVIRACTEHNCVDDTLRIYAMCAKYLKKNDEWGTKSIAEEHEIKTDKFIGFVDVIMEDKDGYWWVVDLKTSAWLKELTIAQLPSDTQLNLYADFAKDFAKHYKLKMSRFGGVRYRVTTKSKLKQRSNESDIAFVKRVYGSIKSIDAVIPKELLNTKKFLKMHMDSWKRGQEIRSGKRKPRKNYGNCGSYFRQCEYWSQCHGRTYTESLKAVKVLE